MLPVSAAAAGRSDAAPRIVAELSTRDSRVQLVRRGFYTRVRVSAVLEIPARLVSLRPRSPMENVR